MKIFDFWYDDEDRWSDNYTKMKNRISITIFSESLETAITSLIKSSYKDVPNITYDLIKRNARFSINITDGVQVWKWSGWWEDIVPDVPYEGNITLQGES